MIGIYKIQNLINGKIYIGQSVHIKARFNAHKSEARNGNTRPSKSLFKNAFFNRFSLLILPPKIRYPLFSADNHLRAACPPFW